MPIKGLTERRRLPRIGKIHLGIRVQSKNKKGEDIEYPKAVDYFVFDPQHPQYDELVKTYGEQPKELHVVFPLDDAEAFASQYYRLYSRSRGLVCKGDGETAMRMFDTKTGALANRDSKEVANKECTCQGRECPEYGRRGCGEVMNLQFLLPEVSGFGVWQIDTGSINSILNVNNALDLVRQIYGRVNMVPLVLALEPKEVTNPDDGKKKTVRVLNVRSEDKMIEAFRKSRMAPLALVQGMAGELYEDGDTLELPEAGDTAPFIDLPSVKEQPKGMSTIITEAQERADTAQAEQDAKDLWPSGGTEPQGEPQPTPVPTAEVTEDNSITLIGQRDRLPAGSPGAKLKVRETGVILEWQQLEKGGRWAQVAIEAIEAPAATVPDDAPTTLAEFLAWLQKHGRKFGPTWFYKAFSDFTPTMMKDEVNVTQAYAEVKEIQGW